ncbi:glycosyltransferase [Teredinibacter sp. KSP-S5-2]|uniref:glycosyltransferase n=1 Tax=Teredinibacter sp. KSP-S5-2 TaxID=3034506 RepID=UPI002934E456|nr:glycosyltransferase [Teredinibacter sp. KSP-S5-2]WNO11608.1 glycosyltransferase [Teredinibacter sp. KSP-S5-2]
MKTNLLFYCEQQYGCGHFQRTANIIEHLLNQNNHYDIHLIFGGRPVQQPEFFEKIDYRLIPMIEGGVNCHFKESMGYKGDWNIYSNLRKQAIRDHILKIDYVDLLLIEFFPFGRKELSPYILVLIEEVKRKFPGAKIISYVREIVDKKNKLDSLEILKNSVRYFDNIFICGKKSIWNFDSNNPIFEILEPITNYIGYICPPGMQVTGNAPPPKKAAIRCISSVGGGRDGLEIQQRFLESINGIDFKQYRLYFDVFLSKHYDNDTINRLINTYECKNIKFHRFSNEFKSKLAESDIHFCMGGYNSVFETLACGSYPVIFPRQWEAEQLTRGHYLAGKNLAYTINQDNISSKSILKSLSRYTNKPPRKDINFFADSLGISLAFNSALNDSNDNKIMILENISLSIATDRKLKSSEDLISMWKIGRTLSKSIKWNRTLIYNFLNNTNHHFEKILRQSLLTNNIEESPLYIKTRSNSSSPESQDFTFEDIVNNP